MEIKNEKGQSVIEFLMSFTLVVGLLMFFFKMALGYTNGYMVHYATFMASRAYLTNDKSNTTDPEKAAFEQAKTVFARLLPSGLISGFNGQLKSNSADVLNFKVFTGVYVEFTQVMASGLVGGSDPVYHRSESFLGREPTRKESIDQICEAVNYTISGGCGVLSTLDDNGF